MDPIALIQKGIAAHQAGDFTDAAKCYETVLQADPEHPDALHFSGLLQSQQGANEEGAELIRQSLRVHPNNPGANNNLGNILKALGRRDEAEAAYRAALELNPDHVDSLNNLGVLLRGRREVGEALSVLEHAVKLRPDHSAAWHNLGLAHMQAGQLDAAADAFEHCVGLGDSGVSDPVWHARVLCALGREARAIAHLEAHLARDPDDQVALHQLAAIRGEAGVRAPDGYVRDHFDSFAGSFDETLRGLGYQAPEAVGRAAQDWARSRKPLHELVDLGCGTGLCGAHLSGIAQRLTGVDLSSGMLERATHTGCYDDLVEAELVGYLKGREPGRIDLAVSADTLCYFGSLDEVMQAAYAALAPGGALIATVEHLAEACPDGYRVDQSGRYAHSRAYLQRVIAEAGLELVGAEALVLRHEMAKPVEGLLITAQRPVE